MFVQQIGHIGQRRLYGCRVDCWREDRRSGWLAMLVFQFENPQVQPLDFLDRKQVNLTQKLGDFGLG